MIKDNFKGHNNSTDELEIESKVVTVGSKQGHRALMVIIVVMLVGVVYYFYLSPSNKENSEVINKEKKEVKQNIRELKDKLEQVPDDIPIPERIIINPLPPLPPIVEPKTIPEIRSEVTQTKKEEENPKEEKKPKEILTESNIPPLPKKHDSITNNFPTSFPTIISDGYPKERRNVQMLAISGDIGPDNKAADANASAQQGKATKMGRLDLIITQGKIIDAILETAINSDIPGVLRAVVSRDVYADAGDTVLIPKGSKLIGSYSFDSNIARARININWNRVILPHGIDVAISSPGTDELGRAGIAGIVNNKIVSALFSSVLLAGVSISTAILGQKASSLVGGLTFIETVRSITVPEIDISSLKNIIGEKDSTKKDTWKLGRAAIKKLKDASSEEDVVSIFRREVSSLKIGNNVDKITLGDIKYLLKEQSNRSVYENVVQHSIGDFSKDIRDIVDRNTDKKPTIYVDQGVMLKVFVNQDIVFPLQAILYR